MMDRIRSVVADVFAGYPEVAAVYLFGSHAERRARPDSDVDLAVMPKAGLNASARKLDMLADCARGGLCNVDLVFLDTDNMLLKFEVIRRNRIVYAVPGYDRGDVFSDIVRRYNDFAPCQKIQREALKRRLLHGAA